MQGGKTCAHQRLVVRKQNDDIVTATREPGGGRTFQPARDGLLCPVLVDFLDVHRYLALPNIGWSPLRRTYEPRDVKCASSPGNENQDSYVAIILPRSRLTSGFRR